MARQESIFERYHRETKYSEEGLESRSSTFGLIEPPSPFKDYRSERQVNLSPYLPFPKNPVTGQPMRPVAKKSPDGSFGIGEISRLLYFTNGVTGVIRQPDVNHLLRAAPSAGALYPTEIYLAIRDVPELENGLYSYLVRDHCLIPLWDGLFWKELIEYTYGHEAVRQARLVCLLSGIFRRSEWRYEERAYRRILLDTGHVLGNMVLAARKEGFAPYTIGGFADEALGGLLFLDPEEEVMLAVVALPEARRHLPEAVRLPSALPSPPGRTSPQSGAPAPASPSAPSSPPAEPEPISLMRRLHHAGDLPAGPSSPDGHTDPTAGISAESHEGLGTPCTGKPIDLGPELHDLVMRRRSTRSFSGAPIHSDELGSILATSYAGVCDRQARATTLFAPELLSTYVIAIAVDELAAGVYRYLPDSREMVQIRLGDYREMCWRFCLGQELGRDAAALVIHVADMDEAMSAFGDRGYRYLGLDAGHIGHLLNLGAIVLDRGASGIGGYFDDEINGLLGLPFRKMMVYVTTIGCPD